MSAPPETPGMTLDVALERVVEAACLAWDTHLDGGGGSEAVLTATRMTIGRAQIAASLARRAAADE